MGIAATSGVSAFPRASAPCMSTRIPAPAGARCAFPRVFSARSRCACPRVFSGRAVHVHACSCPRVFSQVERWGSQRPAGSAHFHAPVRRACPRVLRVCPRVLRVFVHAYSCPGGRALCIPTRVLSAVALCMSTRVLHACSTPCMSTRIPVARVLLSPGGRATARVWFGRTDTDIGRWSLAARPASLS